MAGKAANAAFVLQPIGVSTISDATYAAFVLHPVFANTASKAPDVASAAPESCASMRNYATTAASVPQNDGASMGSGVKIVLRAILTNLDPPKQNASTTDKNNIVENAVPTYPNG